MFFRLLLVFLDIVVGNFKLPLKGGTKRRLFVGVILESFPKVILEDGTKQIDKTRPNVGAMLDLFPQVILEHCIQILYSNLVFKCAWGAPREFSESCHTVCFATHREPTQ